MTILIIAIIFIKRTKYIHPLKQNSNYFNKNFDSETNNTKVNEKINQDIDNNELVISKTKCDKWIILTSINHPTEHIKYMNDALHGWCLLVLGDSKSPANWNY